MTNSLPGVPGRLVFGTNAGCVSRVKDAAACVRPKRSQGEHARVRVSRVAQSCETSKEANRISQKYTANKEFWHENRGIPRMKPLLRRLLRVDGSLSRRNARPHKRPTRGLFRPYALPVGYLGFRAGIGHSSCSFSKAEASISTSVFAQQLVGVGLTVSCLERTDSLDTIGLRFR